ncbi:uncharacterized protein N0V89_010369 [Didymosphaeria variabile]|uniref:F-box domain-containing protein n=1 Tax=Didymosphaeria variabile TaxID=1932322 RepID=A0A9W8XB62_9PLEO|nr:uncharacterized protein N0V89_010369 [Didymosphaeria variabile]KAJ4346440.1 hypothetical protein N0V89_010369 [Didymosphaeria variabile]
MTLNNAPSLTSLPREIFDSIVCEIQDRADISCLSRTSKAIRSLTAELVFENVTMLWTGNDKVKMQNAHAIQKAEIDLQCVGYRIFTPSGNKPKLPPPPDTYEYRSLILAAMRRIGLDQSRLSKAFRAGLETNEFDIVVGLLILLCPNVISITLGLNVLACNKVLKFILHGYALPTECTGRVSRLQHLKDIRLGTSFEYVRSNILVSWPRNTQDWILDLKSYLTLFYLPELKQAQISLPLLKRSGVQSELEWPAESPSYSALQVLRLPDSTLPPNHLHYCLEYTPFVTHLEYEFKMWSYDKLQAHDLASALGCIKDSLRHFKFAHDHWSSEDPLIGGRGDLEDDYEYVIGHCSLKELTALETVTIPACVLLGWLNRNCPALASVLPQNLVSIGLADDLQWFDTCEKDKEDLMPSIQRFVGEENWRESVPRLEQFNFGYSEWEGKDETVALFEENGLKCQFTSPETDCGY